MSHPDVARCIPLRRPPVINRVAGRFVSERAPMAQVDERWEALRADNPRYFDGVQTHVLGVVRNGHGGVTIHVIEASYRFYAVQRTGLDTGARPLGVKGMCLLDPADDGAPRWLMGRRSRSVAFYPDAWEFVPGGSVPADRSPEATLLEELAEETGCVACTRPVPIAVLFDPGALSWEVVYALRVRPSGAPTEGWEHAERRGATIDEPLEPLAAVAGRMRALAERAEHAVRHAAPVRDETP